MVSSSPMMSAKKADDQYTDEEATRRMNEALRRALTTPPKPHSEMKFGKGNAILNKKPKESKARPASKGRVHKGKTNS